MKGSCHCQPVRLILRAASLDDDPGLRPQRHIWRFHDPGWLDYGDTIPSFAEYPPS